MKKDYADYLLNYNREVYNDMAVEFSKTRQWFWDDLNFLLEYIKEGEKVLDLGCGNGRLLKALKEKQVQYLGVDNSEELLLQAQASFPDEKSFFLKADALNLPLKDNEFDKVMSIAVLQHIPSKEYRLKFLKECLRVLKPDGKLILTVWLVKNVSKHYDFKKAFISNLKSFLGLSKMDKNDFLIPFKTGSLENLGDRYVHAFSLKELRSLFKEAGFKLISSGYSFDKKRSKRNIYAVAIKKD